jgi:hypothetical protein
VAKEVHMPVDPKAITRSYTTGEKIPFAYDDPRYVHHAWEEGKWFGRPDATGRLVYAVQGQPVPLKEMAPGREPPPKAKSRRR